MNGLLVAINTEIGLAEQKMLAKLEDIDTSVSLIAGELVRRNSDPPSNGTGLLSGRNLLIGRFRILQQFPYAG